MRPVIRRRLLLGALCKFLILTNWAVAAEFGTGFIPLDRNVYDSFEKAPLHRAYLPKQYELDLSLFPPVGNQGGQGSCTAWAVSYSAGSYYLFKESGERPSRDKARSPAFLFGLLKQDDASSDCYGARISDAMRLYSEYGAPSMSVAPYSDQQCDMPEIQLNQAKDFHFLPSFVTVDGLDKIKAQIYAGNPVVFGLMGTDEFLRYSSGTYVQRGDPEWGHAMVIVGYDDERAAVKIRNSWGTDWGIKGYGWISYDSIMKYGAEFYAFAVPEKKKDYQEDLDRILAELKAKDEALSEAERKLKDQEEENKRLVEERDSSDEILDAGDDSLLISDLDLIDLAIDVAECSDLQYELSTEGRIQLSGLIGSEDTLSELTSWLKTLGAVTSVESNVAI